MKAIIDGKKFDTEKATLIGEVSYGYAGDFKHWMARLYRTKNGRHFLAGSGGPMTIFATRTADGGCSGGSKIVPLDADEAFGWAERHLDIETVEKFFGDRIKDA